MDLQSKVLNLVKTDLDNVLSLSKKYNLKVSSWYWRLNETEEDWINRRVKLSIERNEVQGIILGTKTHLSYTIPLENTTNEVFIEVSENTQTKQVTTSYELLYDTLENNL